MINRQIGANTDGLFLKVESDEQYEECKNIAREWESRTRLTLEWGVSRKIVQKDVNNYIVIEEDNEFESKGAYLKPWLKKNAQKEWVPNEIDYDCVILRKALVDYFIQGTPVRETIEKCNDLRDFQKIVKITRLYKYALYGDKQIKEKVHRVFASNNPDAPGLFKVKSESRIEKIANTPDHCFIFNDYCKGIPCPEELDKQYYVDLAEKHLQDFLSTKKSKSAKLKSDIKYLNYDCKSAIDSIDQSEYDMFSDLVVYLLNEKILNVKQITILIKLDYFKMFGNIKELMRLMELMEAFKYGNTRSFKKEKLDNYAYLTDVVTKHSTDILKSGKTSSSYTIENMDGILHDCEKLVLSAGLSDLTMKEKVACQFDFTGGVYPSQEESDRKTLYVPNIRPVCRKSDQKQFGYNIETVSLGSGIKGRFTIMNSLYKKHPVNEGDVIRLFDYKREGIYFTITDYRVLV